MTPSNLKYPALLFREGYIHIAWREDELSIHSSKTFQKTQKERWQLADSSGALFEIINWSDIARPKGWRPFISGILGAHFAAPKLNHKQNLPPRDLAQEVGEMMCRNKMYGNLYGDDESQFRKDLSNVKTFTELLSLIERAP